MVIKEKILNPSRRLMQSARLVRIDPDRVSRFTQTLKDLPLPEHGQPFFAEAKRNLYFLFFLDSVNFCFWPKKGAPKWGIVKDGQVITGYYAFAEAARRAFEANSNLWEPDYLAEIDFEEFKKIFAGENELQLMPERHEIICENFEILSGFYAGDIERLTNSGAGDVNVFLENLTRDFASFQDKAECRGETLFFLKRAQLLACDFSRSGINFNNLSDLAILADYKLPQLLQAEGVLVYDQTLVDKIAAEELIPEGSEEEAEIRAATVVASEMIREELAGLGREIISADLDFLLWVAAKQRQFTLPHHKTLTINY